MTSNIDLSNTEAEVKALAGFVQNPEAFWSLNDIALSPNDFLGQENKRIMRAIMAVTGAKKDPDMPALIETLKASDNFTTIEYLQRLGSIAVTVPQARDASKLVKGLSVSRQLALAGSQIAQIATEHRADAQTAISEAESVLRKVSAAVPEPDRSPDPADILRRLHSAGATESVRLKFVPTLQDITNGMQPGHLWVIGGFSSTGKSAFAVNLMADSMLDRNKWVMVASTEMTQEQYAIRLLSCLSGVPQKSIQNRIILPFDNKESLDEAERRVGKANLRMFDNLYRMEDIRSQASRMKDTVGLDVLIVDFIQNLRGEVGDYSYGDMTSIILDLQQMAKELRICVVAFSQISNEVAKYQNEGGSDDFYAFKGSGAIKDAADVAIMLKRKRIQQSEDLDVHVLKNRHGELKVIPTIITLATGRIVEATYVQ